MAWSRIVALGRLPPGCPAAGLTWGRSLEVLAAGCAASSDSVQLGAAVKTRNLQKGDQTIIIGHTRRKLLGPERRLYDLYQCDRDTVSVAEASQNNDRDSMQYCGRRQRRRPAPGARRGTSRHPSATPGGLHV